MASIVAEFFYRLSSIEMCRKHNVMPATFQDGKDKFLQGGKQTLADLGKPRWSNGLAGIQDQPTNIK